MGKTIWQTLEQYRGLWVAVDREGKILATGTDLASLKSQSPLAPTYLFACGDDIRS